MPSSDIFTLLSDTAEKQKVLADLIQHSQEIRVKGVDPHNDVFVVIPTSVRKEDVTGKGPQKNPYRNGDWNVILQFDLGDRKYLCQTQAVIDGDKVTLSFSKPLYWVQRREDFRLRLPASFQGSMQLHLGKTHLNCRMIDISAGGCRIEAPENIPLQLGDSIQGTFRANRRDDLEVFMSVRFVGPSNESHGAVILGLQFEKQNDQVKNRMAGLVMDLYREFFSPRP